MIRAITVFVVLTSAVIVSADAPAGQYELHENIVDDKRTGLSWQRHVDAGSYTWEEAKKYCDMLALEGGGWRLPAYKELLTIIDPTESSPSIDNTAFPETPRAWFWTASPYKGLAQPNAWQVFFLDGTSTDAESTRKNRARCVR